MKKIVCFIVIFTLLLSGGVVAFAEDTSEEIESVEPSTSCSIPQTSVTQHLSVTFFVSSGKANVSYYISAKRKNTQVDVLIEKKTLGFIWSDVGRFTDNTNSRYYLVGDYTVPVSGSGEYRATVKFNAAGEKMEKTVYFTYDEKVLLGDVNGDGTVKANDARLILRFASKLQKFSREQFQFADIDSDGKVSASDARFALRMSARL